eukprot:2958740-Rhodomonas_salina.5
MQDKLLGRRIDTLGVSSGLSTTAGRVLGRMQGKLLGMALGRLLGTCGVRRHSPTWPTPPHIGPELATAGVSYAVSVPHIPWQAHHKIAQPVHRVVRRATCTETLFLAFEIAVLSLPGGTERSWRRHVGAHCSHWYHTAPISTDVASTYTAPISADVGSTVLPPLVLASYGSTHGLRRATYQSLMKGAPAAVHRTPPCQYRTWRRERVGP